MIFHIATRTERKKNSSRRFIAAEIEVASVEGHGHYVEETARKWSASIVHDGSIPKSGFEINTAPASGDLYVKQIEELCVALHRADARVTGACGLHVHVDARDYSYYDVRRLVDVYAQIEPALFSMVSPSRRKSHYCQPCGDKLQKAMMKGKLPYQKMKQAVLSSVYGPNAVQAEQSREGQRLRKNRKYCDARYAALNLHSWLYRGTVECRMFGGTIQAEKIISWGRLWATILDFVSKKTDEEVKAELGTLDSVSALRRIVAGDASLDLFILSRIERFKVSVSAPFVTPRFPW